ncbi:MAG: hypothetical protein EB828_05685, partial [Nitrosopumilus sp. D6]
MLVRLAVLIAVLAVLSGVEYAQAQTLDTGAPLYMKSVDAFANQCVASGTTTGVSHDGHAELLADGLFVSHRVPSAGDDPTRFLVSYIEVNAKSTGKSIAVYNFNIKDDFIYNATVPISALNTITDNVNGDVYTTRLIISTIDSSLGAVLFINHTEITAAIYKPLPVYLRDALSEGTIVIAPGGVPTAIGGALASFATISDPPNVTHCSTGSAQVDPSLIGPPVSTGNLFIRQIDSTATSACTSNVTPQTTSTYTSSEGLVVTMNLGDATLIEHIVRAELKSLTNVRDASLALYNFTHDNGVYKFTFPNADLTGITS